MRFNLFLSAALSIATLTACSAESPKVEAQTSETAKPAVTTTDLGNGLYMLVGRGGNVGVAVGPDSVSVIDDQFADMSVALMDAIATISDKPIRYMINTHYHGDHTGGNEKFAAIGASVLAHDNVHKRMSETQKSDLFGRETPPTVAALRPHMTYSENLTFHTAGQKVIAIHVENGHTDGDTIVFFPDANVIHMGDNYFNGLFPYIDTAAGGSSAGMILAQQRALEMANEATQIIPGHGPMASREDLKAANNQLRIIHAKVSAQITAGLDLDATIAADPLKGMEDMESFIDKDNMVKSVYLGLTRNKVAAP